MTTTEDETYTARQQLVSDISELLELWHRLDGQASIPLFGDDLGAGLALHNMVEHVTNLSEAIRTLVAQDISLPIVPLIRLSLECTVTAAWWAADPVSRVNMSNAEEARQKKQLADEIGRTPTGPGDYSDLRDALTERSKELGRPSNAAQMFKNRCDETPGFKWAYGMYRMLSAGSHAGTALMAEYLDVDGGNALNPVGVVIRQRPTWSMQHVGVELQAVLLTIALSICDWTLPERPMRVELEAFAERRGFGDIVEAVLTGIANQPL